MTSSELVLKYRETAPAEIKSFVTTLKKASREMSDFQIMTCLCSISDEEAEECRSLGMKSSDMTPEDRQRLTKAAVLVACSLIFICGTKSKSEGRNKTLLLMEYISYLLTGECDLLRTAALACSYRMKSPGFSITQLENSPGVDTIAYNLSKAEFEMNDPLEPLSVNAAGSVRINGGVISLSSAPSWALSVKSFSLHGGILEVQTRDERDERLKASEVDRIASLEEFSKVFLLSQDKASRECPAENRNRLEVGRTYTISGIGFSDDSGEHFVACHAPYTEHDGVCEVESEELVKGLRVENIVGYFFEDDYIEGAVLVEDGEVPLFSIMDAYMKYANDMAEKDLRSRRVYEAKVLRRFVGQTEDKNRLILLSDKGYGGLMVDDGIHGEGDVIQVYTQSMQGNGLFINMACPGFEPENEVARFDADGALADFVMDEKTASAKFKEESAGRQAGNAEMEIIRRIGIVLAHSREKNSMDRYRDIICSAFLFNVIGDTARRDLAMTESGYLGQCLRMAEGLEVRDISGTSGLSARQKRIIKALNIMDKKMKISSRAAFVQEMAEDDEQKIAELLMAYSLAGSNPDDMKSSPEVIRRKICRLLGVGDHFNGKITRGGGKYGSGELANVEFKSSYVFYNKNGRPDLFHQGRGQVFEAVCGFLNKDGGTVYVGVNDSGEPLLGDDYGLNADLRWFQQNFSTVSRARERRLGHPVPKPVDLDSYCRFLNNESELYFKPGVRGCITISPTEDMDAIRIDVKPSEFEIAKLYKDNTWEEGSVYVRDGEETKVMNRQQQEQRLMNLRKVGKIEKFILVLADAIDGKRKVILKNYASGNSNTVKDRLVVPINLVCNNENLWAYDIDNRKCREFRLARIESIVTDIEDSCYPHAYPPGEADVFRWINPEVNYHIKLRMSIYALNNLKEEYSGASELPAKELYPEDADGEKWILDTTLHGLDAARRFYLGMADQVEIMDTEDSYRLKDAVADFVRTNLSHVWPE